LQEALDKITRKKNQITNELNTKYNVVSNIMNLKKLDYTNAVAEYESEFSQQMQVLSAVRSIQSAENTEEQQLADNARANANIIYNSIAGGTTDISEWTPEQTTLMTKLEVQAELPVGFYKTLAVKNSVTKSSILSIPTRQDAEGNKYADIITQDADGTINIQHVYLGQERLPSGSTKKDTTEADTQKMRTEIAKYAGELQDKMKEEEINWATAWSRMKNSYPQLSTEAIDGFLNISYRDKYDHELE